MQMSAEFHLKHIPALIELYGNHVRRADILAYCGQKGITPPPDIAKFKVRHGLYDLAPFLNQGEVIQNVLSSDKLSEQEIEDEINTAFAVQDMITEGVIEGESNGMISSGEPGIGKTWNIEYLLESAYDAGKIEYTKVAGYARATGLYKLLYQNRFKNQVLLLDDCDSIFHEVTGLNLLKGALDTTKRRNISWRTEALMFLDDGEPVPRDFDYEGRCIFITNVDFQHEIDRDRKNAEHLKALMSRCNYVDLNLRTTERKLIRVKSVVRRTDILSGSGLSQPEQDEIMRYIEEKSERLRELSLRTVVKLVGTMRMVSGNIKKFRLLADGTALRK